MIFLFFFPFLFSCTAVRYPGSGISYSPDLKFEGYLSPQLIETSGIEFYKDKFWSFNDSGGDAVLFSFPLKMNETAVQKKLYPAVNTDWEDISQDSLYMYVADIGNNFGNRDTLVIYRFSKNELSKDSIFVDAVFKIVMEEKTIEFSNCRKNPFDCEALIVKNDSLYLFTKNWQDESSWIYVFPAVPGTYSLKRSSVMDTRMLVTGAYFNEERSNLWLIGYHKFKPSIQVYQFSNSRSFEELFIIKLNNLVALQTEGICKAGDRMYFSYERSRRKPGIYSIRIPQ